VTVTHTETFYTLRDQRNASALYGPGDSTLRMLREVYAVQIVARHGTVRLVGEPGRVGAAEEALRRLEDAMATGSLSSDQVRILALEGAPPLAVASPDFATDELPDQVKGKLKARSAGQEAYIHAMQGNDIVFAIGPAGTGKTFLAVAMASTALKAGRVRKIVLVRPAVEAGEKLGFLPGDFQAKINPYLRPLYDALGALMSVNELARLLEKEQIEIAPLAYMRGRTLQDAFIILDEAQNTTPSQMKMFLTRLGLRSRIVITGDVTQIDLPAGQASGLIHARRILTGVTGIGMIELSAKDIVRHALVQRIVDAYDAEEGEAPHNGFGHGGPGHSGHGAHG